MSFRRPYAGPAAMPNRAVYATAAHYFCASGIRHNRIDAVELCITPAT